MVVSLANNGATTVRDHFNAFCEGRPLLIRRAFDPDPGAIPCPVIGLTYSVERLRFSACFDAAIVSVYIDGIGVMLQIDFIAIQGLRCVIVAQDRVELAPDAWRPAVVQIPDRETLRLLSPAVPFGMKLVVEVAITVRGTLDSRTRAQIENVYAVGDDVQ